MIIISIVSAGLVMTLSNTSQSLATNETLQQATQYAQACAERATAIRKDQGFDWFANNNFTCGNNPSGFTYSTAASNPKLVGNIYTNQGACPNGINCRDINITVTNGSVSSSITIMLADY